MNGMGHRESSALIALSELRDLEADRVRRDQQAREATARAEQLVREQEEQRAREQAERIAAAAQARHHAEEQARLERERQDRLRVMEAEARARVEHEARLREEQLRLQAQVRMSERRAKPRWPLAVVPALVVGLLGAGVLFWQGQRVVEREALQRANAERLAADRARALDAVMAKLEALEAEQTRLQSQRAELQAALAAAGTDDQQAELRGQLDAVDAKIASNDEARGKPSRPKRPRPAKPEPEPKDAKPPRTRPTLDVGNTKDPLAGIR